MKKRITLFILVLLSLITVTIHAVNYVPYQTGSGGSLNYRGSQTQVMIPSEYIEQDTDFRAVWVTHLTGDFPSYQNETQYKREVDKVLDTLEYFNMNAIIFHVRTHNDALYKSELNPVSSYYSAVNFEVFDPLKYVIEESHKRGIEFHAWLNPYRLSSTRTYPSYNIASNPAMRLGSILNPGEPAVREFIIDTVMEIIENYDVDAIHFDDYFYVDGVDDTVTRNKYALPGETLANFRRRQVDIFVEDLYSEVKAYNIANNKIIQIGMSPTGIYRNAGYTATSNYVYDSNGKLTSPVGSSSAGQEHYNGYLYSDTKKWVDEGWVDYLIPQTYWSFEHPNAGYADIMNWWNGVFKYSDVNLYSGMGLYMSGDGNYGWTSNVNEARNQVVFASALEYSRGHSIFSYKHILRAKNNPTAGVLEKSFTKVLDEAWTSYVPLPEIRTYERITLPKATNLTLIKGTTNQLTFNKVEGAKFYAVYRSSSELTFSNSELVKVFAANGPEIVFNDSVGGDYQYGVRAISNTNTLGISATVDEAVESYNIDFYIDDALVASFTSNDNIELPSIPAKVGHDQVAPKWSRTNFDNVTTDIRVDAIYTINQYTVKFYDVNGTLIKTETVEYEGSAEAPYLDQVADHEFISWDVDFSVITEDLDVHPIYEEIEEPVDPDDEKDVEEPVDPEEETEEKEDDKKKPSNPFDFSCKGFSFGIILFTLGFGLYIFYRRRF